MRPIAALLLGLVVAACSTIRPAGTSGTAPDLVARADVRRDGATWRVDYTLLRPAPVWIFRHSALAQDGTAWRAARWTVETQGARIERRGHYDVLRADGRGPVPRTVRLRFEPFPGNLVADYSPALSLGDGSVALFSDQFDLLPAASIGQAAALPLDLNEAEGLDGATRTRFRDAAGPVLSQGERRRSAVLTNARTYVLFGGAGTVVEDEIATIVDPRLPGWLRDEIATSTPRLLSIYTATLGQRTGSRPTVLVSFRGPTPGRRSMAGSVLPGLVLMSFQGDRLLERDLATEQRARWFVAHEAAHFWLGETIRQEFARDAWISEGGADLLAMRAISRLDASYDAREQLKSAAADCARLTTGKALADAGERGENRAYYACGAIFGLVAEAAARRAGGGDFFSFWRGLIERNRADGVVTRDEWLAEVMRLSGDPSLGRDMRKLMEEGAPDASTALCSLLSRAGARYTLDAVGNLEPS